MQDFDKEVKDRIAANGENDSLQRATEQFMLESLDAKYSYNFKWLGRPIIQYPQDVLIMQEVIFEVQPDLIIETGIAHGGSVIFSASMLELNAACGGPADASVVAVDIDIREHNRAAIEAHPMYKRIELIQGSSVADDVVAQVHKAAEGKRRILICLDSNHSHQHVADELAAYADLTSVGSYCVVFDSVVENIPARFCDGRPWGPGDSPMTALHDFLKNNDHFEIDLSKDHQSLLTVAPNGFLKRLR